MEYFAFSKAAPKPCLRCNSTELQVLQDEFEKGAEDFWVYSVPVYDRCNKCDAGGRTRRFGPLRRFGLFCVNQCEAFESCFVDGIQRTQPYDRVDIPIKLSTVGVVERSIHSSAIGEKGSEIRSHGTFISHLTTLPEPELYRQALCSWAPTAMMAFLEEKEGVSRRLGKAVPLSPTNSGASSDADTHLPANPDCEDGMDGTQLKGDEYGHEDRIKGDSILYDRKKLATQVGPDIIPTEVMDGTVGNLKAALAKRVKPLPFNAPKKMIRKIERTVTTLLEKVFTEKRIRQWRQDNPDFEEMKSKKWSSERWRNAWEDALAEPEPKIEQTYQVKINEALPAKGKAPRAIINCGDRAQLLMKLPVRCFEEILFEYFEEASIKHLPKREAMERVAKHLRQTNANLIEGDGSAWDACCNPTIRAMTENRIIEHIIQVLGDDKDCPKKWFNTMLADMKKSQLKGKGKVRGWTTNPIRICIDAIRQSGHAGTSCFNWLINFVCWICVMAENPWDLIERDPRGKLATKYQSARDFKWYELLYAFEGDDSALSTTEILKGREISIEKEWTKLGFRMKLVFVDRKMTFTGYDFLCDGNGPTGVFIPEIARNIASSSWSTSSELKMNPFRVHHVGAAAMLARAVGFKDCGPYQRYFAALGLAHVRRIGDFSLGETDALRLGIDVSQSVLQDLQLIYDTAQPMSRDVKTLVDLVAPFDNEEQALHMLSCDFGTDPLNHRLAREIVPRTVWDPVKYEAARR